VLAACRLRQALENSCLPLGGDVPDAVLTYGRGLLQVDNAWQMLQQMHEEGVPDLR
jgi:tripeptidyl-peptidase-2